MTTPNRPAVSFQCSGCGEWQRAAAGTPVKCPVCGARATAPAAPAPPPPPPPMAAKPAPAPRPERPLPLPPAEEDGTAPRPRRYREGVFKNVLVWLLALVGAWAFLHGLEMSTTAGPERIHNIGLLNQRLVEVVAGLGLLGLSGLLKVVVILEAWVRYQRQPPASGSQPEKSG